MSMANMYVDQVEKQNFSSFMGGNARYNQIKMAKEDIHKTTFRCLCHMGDYGYIVMPTGLKNAGATYKG